MKEPVFKFAIREDLKKSGVSFLPEKATPHSAGWDVKSAERIEIFPGEMAKIHLGFRAFCPDGWWFELKPRSSSFTKKHLHCLYGTIDEDYFGECLLAVQYFPYEKLVYVTESGNADYYLPSLTINFGEALGQIIPVKRRTMLVQEVSNEEYEELCKNSNRIRGAGGFGSTDKNK